MSFIRPEDFMRFFEKTTGARFVDARTGRSVLEFLQEEKEKSNYAAGWKRKTRRRNVNTKWGSFDEQGQVPGQAAK
jgi:hypothetical protein